MKTAYIQRYPPFRAIDLYVEKKIWKLGNPEHPKHKVPLHDYLKNKVVPFIMSLPHELREQCRTYFLAVISKSKPIELPGLLPVEQWFEMITSKLTFCFAELPLYSSKDYEMYKMKVRHQEWCAVDETDYVKLDWKVTVTRSGAPSVWIESINSYEKNKGRAVSIAAAIVQVLQTPGFNHPYACIKLNAYTRLHSTNGAYTWAQLGFGVEEVTKIDKELDGLSPNYYHFATMQRGIISFFEKYGSDIYNLFATNHSSKETLPSQSEWILGAQSMIPACWTSWDIASLVHYGFKLGKHLMSNCDSARFNGVLYPNIVHSPSMDQFRKRVDQRCARIRQTLCYK